MTILRSLVATVTLALLAGAVACGRGTTADLRLELAVKAKLVEKLRVDGARISVSAKGSRVALSGTVSEKASEELAEEVARSVPGVEEVSSSITVAAKNDAGGALSRGAGQAETEVSDAALESKVKVRLVESLGLGAFKIEVEASGGVVSLRGTVKSAEHEKIALAEAKGVKGTRRVINLLTVKE